MKIIKPSYKILYPDVDNPFEVADIYKRIERIARVCYKSEDKITNESAERMIKALICSEHEAMIEHASMSVLFTVDRGISHEQVRHRIASFAQESQRYCSYNKDKFGNEVTFIAPFYWDDVNKRKEYEEWKCAMLAAEGTYLNLIENGATPQEARAVLPNSTKTEIVVTASMREWRHIFKLRAAGATGSPHPQMLEVMVPLLNECRLKMPVLFDDIKPMEF